MMSDPQLQIVVTSIVGGIVTVLLAKINKQGVKAAENAAEVKQTLRDTTTNTDKKLDKIETLVNSKLGTVLRSLAILSAQKAEQTGSEADRLEAVKAKENADQHDAQQAIVDKQKEE